MSKEIMHEAHLLCRSHLYCRMSHKCFKPLDASFEIFANSNRATNVPASWKPLPMNRYASHTKRYTVRAGVQLIAFDFAIATSITAQLGKFFIAPIRPATPRDHHGITDLVGTVVGFLFRSSNSRQMMTSNSSTPT